MSTIETTPLKNLACKAPVLGICEDFITEETQDALLSLIDDSEELKRRGIDVRIDAVGTVFEIPIAGDPLLEKLQNAICEVIGLSSTHAYSFRVRRYAPGQGHGKHHDGYEINGAKLIASTALYLRTPSSGGETSFSNAAPEPIRVDARERRLAYWHNYLPNGQPDERSQHSSESVKHGEKIVLLAFIYQTMDIWKNASSLHSRDLKATTRPSRTFTCIDDSVPAETVRLMKEACDSRAIGFDHIYARTFDFTTAKPLPHGSILYRPAISRIAIQVEQALYQPGVACFRSEPGGVFSSYNNACRLFELAGVPFPRTVPCETTSRDALDRKAAYVGGYPLVLKVLGSSSGIGVIRVDNPTALYSTMDYLNSQGVGPQLMAYVPDAVHWRVVVVGDKAVAAYRNHEDDNDFRTHARTERDDYFEHVPSHLAEVAIRATHALTLEHAGVDVLEHKSGRLFVLEANYPCYFAQAQTAADIDVAGAMVDYLWTKAQSLEKPSRHQA